MNELKTLKDFKQELKDKINHLFGYFDEKGTNCVVDEVVDGLVKKIVNRRKKRVSEYEIKELNWVLELLGTKGEK